MRTFGTYFPIPLSHSIDSVLEMGKKWVDTSIHYPFKLTDLNNLEFNENSLIKNGETISLHKFQGEGFDLAGMRYVTAVKDSNQWTTELVCARDEEKQYVSISVDNQTVNASHFGGVFQVPYLVKMFADQMSGGTDFIFKMKTSPQDVDTSIIADIVSRIPKSNLPVIYLSNFQDGGTAINALNLSKKVFGLAHVVVQKDKKESEELRDLTNGKYPYFGAVGIYWPSKTYTKFLPDDVTFSRILNCLIEAKAKEKFPDQLQLSSIQKSVLLERERTSQIKICELRDSVKENSECMELAELYANQVDSYKLENRTLESQVRDLESEINFLRESLFYSDSKDLDLSQQGSSEIYEGELGDVVRSTIKNSLSSTAKGSRRYQLIREFLSSHEESKNKRRILEKLELSFCNMKKMTPSIIRSFEDCGFLVEHMKGGHYKLSHPCVQGISMNLPSTPSDHRTTKNTFSRIKKTFF